ncbi:hypothetical protein ACFX11_028708 [Malus domestica]
MERENEEQVILTDWVYDCYKGKTLKKLLEDEEEARNDMKRLLRRLEGVVDGQAQSAPQSKIETAAAFVPPSSTSMKDLWIILGSPMPDSTISLKSPLPLKGNTSPNFMSISEAKKLRVNIKLWDLQGTRFTLYFGEMAI